MATARVAAALPNTSLTGLWLFLFPLWLEYKISGTYSLLARVPELGSETMVDLVVARTLYFDRIIERNLGQVEQFVVIGAGYDTRAYGRLRRQGTAFFELDQSRMQAHKLESLEIAGIASDHVTFVSIDFAKESVSERLLASGFDASKKTLFLWEGVTLYLSEADVRKTLLNIRDTAAAGSMLLADIYAERVVESANKGYQKMVLDLTDEGLNFGLDISAKHEEVLAEFVQNESMSVGECFFMGTTNDKGPFVVIVEMKIDWKSKNCRRTVEVAMIVHGKRGLSPISPFPVPSRHSIDSP